MSQLTRLQKTTPSLTEINKLLDRVFGLSPLMENQSFFTNELSAWTPSVDVREDDKQYLVRADVPGVDPKNIEVAVDAGVLIIKGQKEVETKDEGDNFVHIERTHGSFFRSINLPDAIDAEKISAKTKNGVLEIIVPKSTATKRQKITIKSE